jgi:hypothetical protein
MICRQFVLLEIPQNRHSRSSGPQKNSTPLTLICLRLVCCGPSCTDKANFRQNKCPKMLINRDLFDLWLFTRRPTR